MHNVSTTLRPLSQTWDFKTAATAWSVMEYIIAVSAVDNTLTTPFSAILHITSVIIISGVLTADRYLCNMLANRPVLQRSSPPSPVQ